MLPFTINPSAIPTVRTREALLILDLQNDFVSPDGALHADEPDGYVERILDLAKTFRDSGAGDVIWVRSEFDRPCSLMEDGDQIITADALMRPKKGPPSRGRQQASPAHDGAAMENDDEAFLSVGTTNDKKPCVRKGTEGAEFAADVKAAIVPARDIVLTKTHYSAFASGQTQLVQLLRGRFVTQMYVCGALTNISIYATALGAGQHGYDVTLIEDCCGFRSTMRHLNAVRQLVHLTGCEVVSSEGLTEQLQPPAPAPQARSTGLSPSISKISLARGGGSPDASPAAAPPLARRATPPNPASPQPDRDEEAKPRLRTPPRRRVSNQSSRSVDTTRPSHDTGPLKADSDPSPSESESTRSPQRKPEEAQRNARPATVKPSELESSKGPTLLPGPRDAKAERPRVINRVKQRLPRPSLDKKPSTPTSPESIATRHSLPRDTAKPEAKAASKDIPKTESRSPRNMAGPQQPPASSVTGEPLCEGDTTVITDVLPPALAADAFERLLEEVSWAGMSHMGGEVPRRIAVQGDVAEDGSMPVYRHPADESPPLLPFSPTVLQIKNEAEKHLGHPLNHVLIQHYRTGNDYISEHSDKTLDIAKGSFIVNVSLGAERTMIFRTKRPPKEHQAATPPNPDEPSPQTTTTTTTLEPKRQTHRAPLPHNSLLRMGLATNARWLHSIRQDKRLDRDKTPSELAFSGARISLTFRQIATFIDASQTLIWGQGATCKTREGARAVVNGQTDEAVRMLKAFGAENNKGDGRDAATGGMGFEWDGWYGGGFDVLHMGTPKRVFSANVALAPSSSADGSGMGSGEAAAAAAVVNTRVALALAELGVSCAKGSVEGGEVRFEDNDPGRAVVEGHASVLRYLDAVYGAGRRYDQMGAGEVAKRFTRLQKGLDLWGKWRAAVAEVGLGEAVEVGEELREKVRKVIKKELADWEAWAEEAAAGNKPTTEEAETGSGGCFYIAGGNQPSPADFAVWPVLHDMVRVCGEDLLSEHLRRYYAAFRERSSVAKALGQLKAE